MLLAQVMPESDLFRLILQGGAFAILVVVFILFVKYFWPEMKEYRKDNKEARETANVLILKQQAEYIIAINDMRDGFEKALQDSIDKMNVQLDSARRDFLLWQRAEIDLARTHIASIETRFREDRESERMKFDKALESSRKLVENLYQKLLDFQDRRMGHEPEVRE